MLVTGRNEQRAADVVAEIERGGGTAAYRLTALDGARPPATWPRGPKRPATATWTSSSTTPALPRAGLTESATEAEFDQAFAINVKVPFFLVAALAPAMAARGQGAIVNISTMVASFGQPGMAAYGASRAALELLTKAWAAEYGPRGVRVNAVAPGPTRTPMNDAYGDMPERFAALAPAGRVAEPEEIAAAIAYLASDEASFIHGATIPVDGGRTAT